MIENMLVPLDGSKLAEQALDVAVDMAVGLNSKIVLCRVVPPPVPGRFYSAHMLDELQEAQVREAEAYLAECEQARLQSGLAVESHVETGEVATTVVDFAQANQCDMIVMSSHGLGGRGWNVFGSVAQKVLNSAKQPVLIVKPDPAAWELEEEDEEEKDDEAMFDELAKAGAGRVALPPERKLT